MKRITILTALLATVLLTTACGATDKIGSAASQVNEAVVGKPLDKVYACNRKVEVDQTPLERPASQIAYETMPPSEDYLAEWTHMIIERNNLIGTENLNGREILIPKRCGQGKQKETAQ